MTQGESPSLEELESRVKMTTSSKRKRELTLVVKLLQSYIDGFNLINSFTLTDDNEVQYAWLLLITQSFHSMRCALLSMQIGYYGQAMSLLRIATEDWFACEDCQKNARTLKALLHNEGLKLNYGDMAQNAGAREIVYKGDYHFLSRFTHVCKLSLAIIRNSETNELKTAPAYDEVLFLSCCEMLIRNAIRIAPFMQYFLSKLSNTKVDSWRKVAEPPIKEAADWLREQQQKYGDEDITSAKTDLQI